MADDCPEILQAHCCCDATDYTFYLPAIDRAVPPTLNPGAPIDPDRAAALISPELEPEDQRFRRSQLREWAGETDGYSYDCAAQWQGEKDGPRLLACRCFQGRYWSISGRGEQTAQGSPREWTCSETSFDDSLFKPQTPRPDDKNDFLFPASNIVDTIGDAIGLANRRQGLLLVAGSTKTAKTVLARGLVHQILVNAARREWGRYTSLGETQPEKRAEIRKPHLVTFEDPIEKWFWKGPTRGTGANTPAHADVLDYTPRQRNIDAASLDRCLQDALRQTPTVFYIGEIRDQLEWAPTIEFAGTGHIVVATAHGGSLTETIVKIAKALNATTPAQRNYIADRLLAVVHVRSENLDQLFPGAPAGLPAKVLVGSLWQNVASGVHALTSGGFSSLLAANPSKLDGLQTEYCLGECWWARSQLAKIGALLDRKGCNREKIERSMVCDLMHKYLEAE